MNITNKLILENSKALNILYIDDDKTLLDATSKLLLNFFNSVDTAMDGVEGLKMYLDYKSCKNHYYDLVITDINMPKMDGIEMSKKIKDENFEQAIIFVTAHDELDYLHNAIKLGADGFLIKPLEIMELKTLLYKTTQAISDRYIVRKYYEQIEESNIQLVEDKRTFCSAKSILDDLNSSKESILKTWISSPGIQGILAKHTVDDEYFRTHYGMKIIEYFIDVISGDSEIGNCPAVLTMIEFFKHKHFALKDIFMICVAFKNSVTSYVFDKYSFNNELFKDISLILDKNFEGAIINYMKIKGYSEEYAPDIEKNINSATKLKNEQNIENIVYSEYVFETDVYELQDLEQEIDSLAIAVTMNSNSTLESHTLLGLKIKRYGEILSNYPLFEELGIYIIKLGINLSQNDELLFNNKDKMSNITTLIEGFVNDLIIWRKEIFINNIENYKFLDSSISSNVDTIIMFIKYDETAENSMDSGDMEFF